MSQIIAGLYELGEKIGAGGGGTVYLGRHTRLEKQIVLKADKRELSAGAEKLQREVNLLKNLSHTYIPQVYDFVQEDGIAYTVMDYIEGESLDRLLNRRHVPAQSQVIHWACQLLEALDYLHSQPPHGILHGDIKPGNIMLRPNGDVCLIDFNIALALGEDGAVKVGYSRGYASPEHYGADDMFPQNAAVRQKENDKHNDETRSLETETIAVSFSAGSVTRGQKGVLLDVRSDIYSLGATLYHIISGQRPAQDARDVLPLGQEICSEAVSKILQKAMMPKPEQRYQTAGEMLDAFLQLHQTDKRIVRHKRRMAASAAMFAGLFLIGGGCTFIGLKQTEQRNEALALAEYSSNALAEGDVSGAVRLALEALDAPVTPQAQKALTDALGVYDMSDGFKAVGALALPSAPFKITMSPEGSYLAVVYAYEAAVYDMSDCRKTAALPVQNSALSDAVLIDEETILYAGSKGITLYDLKNQKEVWVGDVATAVCVSGDRKLAAAVNRDDGKAAIYNVSDGRKLAECPFGGRHMPTAANDIFADPDDDIFALNDDGSILAVSFSNGGLMLFDWGEPDDTLIIYEESDYTRFDGGFYGRYFAFAANGESSSLFGLIDTAEGNYIGGYESGDDFLLKADEGGIYLANGNLLARFHPDALEETELAYTDNANITGFSVGNGLVLVATDDNRFAFFDSGANMIFSGSADENCDFTALSGRYAAIGNRSEAMLRIMKEVEHGESQILAYDARYSHDEARISPDGRTAMLFDYKGFAIYGMDGSMVKRLELPDAGQIYDQQFRKAEDASYLEVIWYDGTVRHYDAKDGSVIMEEKRAAPDKSLYEEFYTDKYRIESPLHSAPKVYALDSDKLIATLETDSYLTYVTQMDEYIITEYISAEGERYGLLLDSGFQTIAYLPELCDVSDGMLVFDYKSGNLRQCRLYSLQELIALGEIYLEESERSN